MNLRMKLASLITFVNLSIFNAAAYHDSSHGTGATVSIPSYSDPLSFAFYLALPALLGFLAIQQPVEKKLQSKWRRNEPARKYSSIIAGLIILTALISPVFHSFPQVGNIPYIGFLTVLGLIAFSANNWETVKEKLPV